MPVLCAILFTLLQGTIIATAIIFTQNSDKKLYCDNCVLCAPKGLKDMPWHLL